MSVLPIRTSRLSLRVMRLADAEVLASYRNLPDVARYQDWPMPFDLEQARRALGGQDLDDDVSPGGWTQIAIEHEGEVVGDLALGLSHPGIAHLGYTLAPQHHGKGFAREAAGALVDAVFARTDVHRVVATLDPENHASMRVVEQLGFRYEGIARASEPIRGEWLDDMRFALLRSDRAEWLRRPTSTEQVELVEVTHHNLAAVSALETHRFQRRFVAPMERNLAQALVPPEVMPGHLAVPWYRAVVADGEVVGFVLVSAVSEVEPHPFVWRLLIDRMHQRRGVGTRTIAALATHFRADGASELRLGFNDGPGSPRRFYERLGFVPTGELDGDEVIARLAL
jgi:RimJ/RimL family protein N-acetyltransferase